MFKNITLKKIAIMFFLFLQVVVIASLIIKIPNKKFEKMWSFQNENFVLDSEDGAECLLTKEKISIPSGAYYIKIRYLVDNPDDLKAQVKLLSEECPDAITNSIINLEAGRTEMDSRFWISYGESIKDLTLTLSSNAYCRIDSIWISEIISWRLLRLGGFLLIFVLLDIGVFFILRKGIENSDKKQVALILAAIAFFAFLPEITNFSHYQHDYLYNLNRILSIEDALFNGAFPVRIHFRLLHGYGFANSIFYGDILLYLPAALYHMGMPLYMAYKVYLLMITVGTVWISYGCFFRMCRNQTGALTGALVYSLAPYRLINTMVRGAAGEYTAMMFMPLVCYGFYIIYKKEDNVPLKVADLVPLIVGYSGIIESHILSVEIITLFAVLFCMVFFKKTFKKKRIFGLAKAVLITLALNAWFIIPFLDYARMPFKYQITQNRIQNKGVFLAQLLSIFYTDTMGHSVNGMAQEMPLLLGGAFLFVILVFAYIYIYQKRKMNIFIELKVFFCMGIIASILSTVYFPWEWLRFLGKTTYKIFNMIQYPWRYLGIATVSLSFMCVLMYIEIKGKYSSKAAKIYIGLVWGLCIIPTSMFYTDYLNHWEENRYYCESDVNSDRIGDDLYLPIGTDLSKLEIDHPIIVGDNEKTATIIKEYERYGGTYTIEVDNPLSTDYLIEVPLINYRDYCAYDAETGIPLPIVDSENHTVYVQVAGRYQGTIAVKFREPWYWRAGELVTIFTLIGLCAYGIVYKRNRTTTV